MKGFPGLTGRLDNEEGQRVERVQREEKVAHRKL